ncbi:hypothetical protein DL767_001496 [Monosporascus sp. MG133]|nr:hypothetical protein DL767_001496 [Monosporascus sp. MG133]
MAPDPAHGSEIYEHVLQPPDYPVSYDSITAHYHKGVTSAAGGASEATTRPAKYLDYCISAFGTCQHDSPTSQDLGLFRLHLENTAKYSLQRLELHAAADSNVVMRLCKAVPQSSARLCRYYSSSHRIYRHYATGKSRDVAQPRAPSAAATKEPKNQEESFNVDPVNKKIETAVGDLPLSPVMDPSFWEARQRYQTPKAKAGKAQNSVERQFRANPFAKALATPLRQCSITHQRLPKFFLQDFNLIQHPETGAPWWVPRSLMRHESHVAEHPDKEEILEAIQKEEAAISAEKDVTTTTPENEEGKASVAAETDTGKEGRPYGPSVYALARKDLFAAFTTERSGFMNSHKRLFGGSSSRYRIFGSRAVWREDMDTYILDLMRRQVVDHLLYLSRLCAEQARYYIVRCYGWDDVQHKHKGALLWFQNEAEGETPPGPFATFDTHTRNLHGENNPVTVAVHNMPMLLGDEQAARLKSEARVFGEGSIFMLAGRRTTDLQANLWRLQGYLADYRNIP